jgi:hypothetical protein
MVGDSSYEEIELAAMTLAMAAAHVCTREGEKTHEGAKRLQRVCGPQVVL